MSLLTELLVHTEKTFDFVANSPIAVVAPLFGAEREKVWAPGWEPHVVWPRPAAAEEPKDQQGMVFKIAREDGRTAVWVNTLLDLQHGRIQYAYVVPDMMVTVITLQLQSRDQTTHVTVKYDRTALKAEANEQVSQMAVHDAKAGPEWAQQINGYLQSQRSEGR